MKGVLGRKRGDRSARREQSVFAQPRHADHVRLIAAEDVADAFVVGEVEADVTPGRCQATGAGTP